MLRYSTTELKPGLIAPIVKEAKKQEEILKKVKDVILKVKAITTGITTGITTAIDTGKSSNKDKGKDKGKEAVVVVDITMEHEKIKALIAEAKSLNIPFDDHTPELSLLVTREIEIQVQAQSLTDLRRAMSACHVDTIEECIANIKTLVSSKC